VQATAVAPVTPWLEAVAGELQLLAREQGWGAPLSLDTVYVGGGTPSTLGPGAMHSMREAFGPHARWADDAVEWTAEANPESFTAALAIDWRDAGINRVSLGVQTFHEPALRWMGRLHGAEGPGRAMAAARAAGLRNVSIDLIFGLPERLGRDWSEDLDRALSLEPDHISLYGLTAEVATPLGRWVGQGRETLADQDRYAEEYLLAHERLTSAGFEHYEVSNFARPGLRSRHNFAYWTGVPYAALGPGAHSFHPPARRWNLRGWEAYRDAVAALTLPREGEEIVSGEELMLERVWLALRTDRGYHLGTNSAESTLAADWVRLGLATVTGEVLRLSADGWLLLDGLALELSTAVTGGARMHHHATPTGHAD
jgi:oxygen-independent coproporphyrinogen III oxidase